LNPAPAFAQATDEADMRIAKEEIFLVAVNFTL